MTSDAEGIKVTAKPLQSRCKATAKSLNSDAVFTHGRDGASERLAGGVEMNDRACLLARFFLFCRAIIFNCKKICIFASLKLYIIRNAEK